MLQRLFIPMLCLIGSSRPLLAQSGFLISGGVNLSTFILDAPDGAQTPDQSFRFGGGVLLGGQNQVTENFAVAGGVGYETRGSVMTGTDDNGNDVDVTLKFNYIHVPLILKFMANPSGASAKPYFAPSVGLNILTTSEAEANGDHADVHGVSSIDFSLGAAVGFQVPLQSRAFFMEAGYDYGLLNTSSDGPGSANNSNIRVRLGFIIGS